MPTINGQRVLSTSPLAQSQLNSRGGINKVSNREARGDVSLGSTGVSGSDTFKAGTVPNSVPPASLSVGNIPAPEIPKTVPAEALSGDNTIQDVFAKRNQMDTQNQQRLQLGTDYDNLLGRINAPLSSTPLSNPEAFINQTLLRQPTQTETQLSDAQRQQAQGFRDISTGIEQTRAQATEQFALPELQQQYAETQNRISERTVQLRQDIRDFEVNAEKRGVAREFVEDAKRKVQADAAAELADLSIIASAQQGNIQMAQESIDRSVEAKLQAFQFENAAIETEIKRLATIDSKEADARKEQLQIALQERNRNIEQAVADEKQRLQYLSEAAANGADQGTLMAIQKSKSPSEAALLAGPFIGRLDRQLQQAQLANTYSQISSRELNDTIALAEAGDVNAIAKLGLTLPDNTKPTTDLIAYAQQYAATGKIPTGMPKDISFGDVAEYAKDLPKPTGTLVNANTGVTDTSLGQAEKDDMTRLYNIVQLTQKLKALDEERIGGVVAGVTGKVFGSEAQNAYLTTRRSIVDELARMQTGAALTNDEQAFYNDYLPGRFSESFFLGQDSTKVIENFESIMNEKLGNALKNNQLSIYGYSKIQTPLGEYTVGDTIEANGQRGIVNPDGTVTLINQ